MENLEVLQYFNNSNISDGTVTGNSLIVAVNDTALNGGLIAKLQSGFHNSMLLTSTGDVFTWGKGIDCRFQIWWLTKKDLLALNTTSDKYSPTMVQKSSILGKSIVNIFIGDFEAFALTSGMSI